MEYTQLGTKYTLTLSIERSIVPFGLPWVVGSQKVLNR
jgi:hypothetical protein